MAYLKKFKGASKTKNFQMVLILLVFTLLVTSAAQGVIGEGNGEGNQSQEQNGEVSQNQEQNGEGSQNQEQNGEGNQNQEQNGEGSQNQEQNGEGSQNQEQNGEGSQNQEQNGEGNQNQEQNGEGNQNQEQNGEGNQNQEQNGEGNQNQEQNGEGNQNQCQNGNCNCNQEQKGEQQQNQNCTGGCECNGKMYQYKWHGANGNCISKHQGNGEGNQWRYRYQHEIKAGAENGTVVMETTFMKRERYMLQENNHYQMGMEVELLEVKGNRVRVRVRAEFTEGKVVAINIAENVLKFGIPNESNVYFDGQQVSMGTVEEVISAKGTEAKYVGETSEGGAQFLVYIPHFSEHIIEIESLLEQVKDELFTRTNYMVMGFSILALVGLTGHIFKIGKSRK